MSLLTNWLESLSYDLEAAAHCVRQISPFSTCTTCVDSCPKQVISIENGKLKIDHQFCNSCGRCIPICPVQALIGVSPRRKAFNNMLIFDDGPSPTTNELFYLYKKGIRSIYIKLPEEVPLELPRLVDEVNEQLQRMEKEPITLTSDRVMPPQEKKVSRRDFFSNVSMNSKKLALATAAPAKWRFNHEQFKIAGMFDGWSLYAVDIQPSCNLCETCFKLCPSNVFTLKDGQLEINSEKCNGCMLCINVCMEEGVTIKQEAKEAHPSLANVQQNNCNTCHLSFSSWEKEEICQICKKRKKQNFLF